MIVALVVTFGMSLSLSGVADDHLVLTSCREWVFLLIVLKLLLNAHLINIWFNPSKSKQKVFLEITILILLLITIYSINAYHILEMCICKLDRATFVFIDA